MNDAEGVLGELQKVILPFEEVSASALSLTLFILLIVLVVAFVFLATKTYKAYLRKRFHRKYRIKLQKNISIHLRKNNGENYYLLEFPAWKYANKDGSCDRRRNDNFIHYGTCVLYVDNFKINCSQPAQMIWLVNHLRVREVPVEKCPEELKKFSLAAKKAASFCSRQTLSSLIERFQSIPTDFEEYCAYLYELDGYISRVTPQSRDGGYDIELYDDSGFAAIIECKCYALVNKIGREYIQKLVGANATQKAKRMIFITTSSFTLDAVEYARNVGVELIDGDALLSFAERLNSISKGTPIVKMIDWKLSRDDLIEYLPPDYPQTINDLG